MASTASWVIRRDENGLFSWEPKEWSDETREEDWPAFEVSPPGVHYGDHPSRWPCRANELYCPHRPACKNYV